MVCGCCRAHDDAISAFSFSCWLTLSESHLCSNRNDILDTRRLDMHQQRGEIPHAKQILESYKSKMLDALVITVKERESRVSSIQKELEPFSIKCHVLEAIDARKSSVYNTLKPFIPKHVLFQMGKQRKLHREVNT